VFVQIPLIMTPPNNTVNHVTMLVETVLLIILVSLVPMTPESVLPLVHV
jgi:hypothetical protein